VEYEDFRTVVELDGRIGHSDEARFRDYRRDNDASVRGHVTLRYGWTDTTTTSCRVAHQVAEVLKVNGWQGRPRPCGPFCEIEGRVA
jgi:very-short-patch-repair endonuclease